MLLGACFSAQTGVGGYCLQTIMLLKEKLESKSAKDTEVTCDTLMQSGMVRILSCVFLTMYICICMYKYYIYVHTHTYTFT